MKRFLQITKISLKENQDHSVIEVLRVGTIRDRGLKITKAMLENFVKNFKADVVGQNDEDGNPELPVNIQHRSGDEAVGWIKDLFIEEDRLMAKVEWTELGQEKIEKKLFKFVSAEFFGRYPHHKTGKVVEYVFTGLAFTNTPALKAQKPLSLSEDTNKLLTNFYMFKQLLNNLKERKIVSAEDKKMLREMLEELPEEEKKEHEGDIKDIESKPEEEEKKEENKESEEEKKEREQKEEAEKKEKENMEEKLGSMSKEMIELREKNEEMTAKIELGEIKEEVARDLVVNDSRNLGFIDDNIAKVAEFMQKLTVEQRKEFKEILGLVKHVELGEFGSVRVSEKDADEKSKLKEADEKAEKLAAEKGIAKHEALAQIYEEMNLT